MPSRSNKRKDRQQWSFAFQRLLIVHQDLVEICTGYGLDEGASLEELSEHILYYYDADQNVCCGDSTHECSCSCRTAASVKFSGLCSALHSLPSTLLASSENDVAKQVHLTEATLVFVVLEPSILAVAQIPRYSVGPDSEGAQPAGGNPLAVQVSIQRCHELFCLIRGGGIHHRLSTRAHSAPEGFLSRDQFNLATSEQNSTEEDKSDLRRQKNETYPGMSTLYALRKRKRKLSEKLSKLSPPHTLEQEEGTVVKTIESVDEEIHYLLRTLPIQPVRDDLCIHYDEYLAELKSLTHSEGVAGRCIVENVPACGPRGCLQQSASAYSEILLGRSMQELLDGIHRDRSDEIPRLFGVSAFSGGQLVCTHLTPSASHEQRGGKPVIDEAMSLSISPQTAVTLNGYMLSFRGKVCNNQYSSSAAIGAPSTPPRSKHRLGRPWSIDSDRSDEKPVSSTSSDEAVRRGEETMVVRGFLEPPPLSMLSTADQIYEVHVPSFDPSPVWMPRIFLPVIRCSEMPAQKCCIIETHVALFEVDNFSFLLYMVLPKTNAAFQIAQDTFVNGENSTVSKYNDEVHDADQNLHSSDCSLSAVVPLLKDISDHLISCLKDVAKAEIDTHSQGRSYLGTSSQLTTHDNWDESGQDIVFVDRRQHKLTIFTKRDAQPAHSARTSPARDRRGGRISINFLGVRGTTSGKERNSAKGSSRRNYVPNTQWPSIGFDGRHALASHLPLDVILAFDDVMNEVHQLMNGVSQPRVRVHIYGGKVSSIRQPVECEQTTGSQEVGVGVVEVCTFLPQGWVFAYAKGDRELYILFDTEMFVTIADVHNAAVFVRRRLFGEPPGEGEP